MILQDIQLANCHLFIFNLVPPFIVDEETSSDPVVDERSKLSLHCKANGYPLPTIIWRREDGKSLGSLFIDGKKIPSKYTKCIFVNHN